MSRIGKQPVNIPEGVSVRTEDNKLVVSGPKGELRLPNFDELNIEIDQQTIRIKKKKETDKANALHGLLRALLANAVEGVSQGFEKRLELVGTGYRVKSEGDTLILSVGYSHPVKVEPIEGITLETEGEKEIIVNGIDKQQVGQVAANIRNFRKPEPYKGKGVRYKGEMVRRKPGKAAKVGSSGGA